MIHHVHILFNLIHIVHQYARTHRIHGPFIFTHIYHTKSKNMYTFPPLFDLKNIEGAHPTPPKQSPNFTPTKTKGPIWVPGIYSTVDPQLPASS